MYQYLYLLCCDNRRSNVYIKIYGKVLEYVRTNSSSVNRSQRQKSRFGPRSARFYVIVAQEVAHMAVVQEDPSSDLVDADIFIT